jgi:hypothetical protein
MAITKVSPALIQVANNVTSTTIGNTTSIPSLTFDASGVIIAASNTTVTVANTNITGNIISSQITSVANTQLTGTVTNAQVGSSVYEGMGMRNRIINGDMRIDQRNDGAAVTLTAGGIYTVDRWQGVENTDGAMTALRYEDVLAGFVTSVKCTTTTADGSLASSQNVQFRQAIEGLNVADLGWGTANAKTITLSFWVRSSLTGTFGGSLRNSAVNRSYPFTYAISVADTWEYKTVTIAGDTSGTWLTTTSTGIILTFSLGAGTDFSGTAGAWAGANNTSATGAVSVIGTLNATWYITGVQLEVGSVATPFERRPFGTELSLCQRYYLPVTSGMAYGRGNGTSGTVCSLPIPVPLRATPTLPSTTTSAHLYSVSGYSGAVTATWSDITLLSNSVKFQGAGFSGGTDNRPNLTEVGSGFYFSAEL